MTDPRHSVDGCSSARHWRRTGAPPSLNCWVLALLVGGCSPDNASTHGADEIAGGQTGDENRDTGGAGSTGQGSLCGEVHRRPVQSADEELAPGLSERSLMELATGQWTERLYWNDSLELAATGTVGFGPESGVTELSLTLTATGAPAEVVEHGAGWDAGSGGSGSLPGPNDPCAPALELPVEVKLDSSGGAFAERFETVVIAKSSKLARFDQTLPAADLAGALRFDLASREGTSLSRLSFASTLSQHGSSGSAQPVWAVDAGGAGGSGGAVWTSTPGAGSLATWPAAGACNKGSVPVAPDSPGLVLSPQAVLDALTTANSAQLEFPDGASYAATLSITHEGQAACIGVEGPALADGSVKLGVTLRVSSAAAGIDQQYQATVVAVPGPAGGMDGATATLETSCTNFSQVAQVTEACGDWGLDLSTYEAAAFNLRIDFDPLVGEQLGGTGTVTVTGHDITNTCGEAPSEPGASGACGGSVTSTPHVIDIRVP